MKRLIAILVMMVVGVSAATAQRYYDDRHFYDEDFDWHWDVRLRISDGERSGLLTNWEANRLYKKLERIEEKEYAYMADGNYDRWEQNDIWDDVVWLNRRVGIELYDYDRRFYGFGNVYIGFNSYPFWYNRWYANGWDFYRYDRLGWGSWRYGYVPRYYVPVHNVYVHNHIHKGYNHNNGNAPGRTRYDGRSDDNVIRRDRTDPANRVDNSSRRSTSTAPSGNATRRSYESGSSSSPSGRSSSPAASGRTYSPRNSDDSSVRSSSPSSRSGSPSSSRVGGNSGSRSSSAVGSSSSSRSSRSSSSVGSTSSSRSSSASRSSSGSSSRSSSGSNSSSRSSSGSSRSSRN